MIHFYNKMSYQHTCTSCMSFNLIAICLRLLCYSCITVSPHIHCQNVKINPSKGEKEKCMIIIFWGDRVMTPSKPPPPYEQLLPLPTPYFKMFLERSLNDPPPPHFKHLSLLLPTPSTTPTPKKILIIHKATLMQSIYGKFGSVACCVYNFYSGTLHTTVITEFRPLPLEQ